ncbi:exporter of polyketide antibiotics [Plantactinospora mayteni]|uniref:Exporter of polyketide antibiotics n=1 Tax=Plantactinospora mayteni TaxID=566021 RepID=A0ABQ4EV48_9ACTN|nr:anibiotic ABC transporter [Plantactinospora mayteni]GIG98479.1 exporter of polyketide antibiotics [Plantactinospora mayteni]
MGQFTGTGRLVRLALRRDRIQLPLWILGTALVVFSMKSAVVGQFPTEKDRLGALRAVVDTPAILMFRNSPTGLSDGDMLAFGALTFIAVVVGFMSTLAVVRHTRQNEETGRTEMIGSMAVGRRAPLTAAMIVVTGANLVLAVLSTLALIASDLPTAGSLAFGLGLGAAGLTFAAIAAVAAQIVEGARSANGIAASAIGAAYLLRGVGDAFGEVQPDGYTMTTAWPTWLSPIGWATLMKPYAGNRWWLLVLPVLLFVVLLWLAFALADRRDIGMGMIAARRGPARAVPRLLSPLGLAWRLQRATLIGWAVAFGVFGALIGSVASAASEAFDEGTGAARTLRELGGDGALTDSFYAAMLTMVGGMAAAYVVQAMLRVRAEEAGGRAEATLATGVGRLRWLGSHLVIAVLGAMFLLLFTGLLAGLLAGLNTDDVGGALGDLVPGAVAQMPATLIMIGYVVLVFGLVPRLAGALGWLGLGVAVAFGQFGELLNLPQAVMDISPFSHVPALPVAEATATPLVMLAVVAVLLGGAGVALFRRRDLAL